MIWEPHTLVFTISEILFSNLPLASMNMIKNSIPYGFNSAEFFISESYPVDFVNINKIAGMTTPIEAVAESLHSNQYGACLEDFTGCKTAAIAINDKTRPVPYDILLPALIDGLKNLQLQLKNITIIVATGTHKPMDLAEIKKLLPDNFPKDIKICSHDCDEAENLKCLGDTSKKTPVYGNRKFLDADIRIVTGNIEPHHFAGFSGGMKTAAIGLTGRETINKNHSMLVDRKSCLGEFKNNPLRQDIEEIGKMMKVNYAINVIMNDKREIVHVLAGDPSCVMDAGVTFSQSICQTVVNKKYDLVIASAGGYPKDINLYQAQKALTNASLITRDGGSVILVAACDEGVGSNPYVDFMKGVSSWQEVYSKFKTTGFQVGPHKAFQFAREISRINVYLMSHIPDEVVKSLLLIPTADLTNQIQQILKNNPGMPAIAVMPKATNTLPLCTGG